MDINWSQLATDVSAQLVIFLFVLFVLNKFIFQPLLRIHALRTQQTEAKQKEAEEIIERSQTMVESYDKSIQEARAEALRKIQAASQEGAGEAKKIVTIARDQGQQIFVTKKDALEADHKTVANDLKDKVEKVSDDFVQAIL